MISRLLSMVNAHALRVLLACYRILSGQRMDLRFHVEHVQGNRYSMHLRYNVHNGVVHVHADGLPSELGKLAASDLRNVRK